MEIEPQSSFPSPSLLAGDTPRVSSGIALPYHIVQTARWNNEAAATLINSNSMNPHTIAAAHQQLVAALELAKRGHAASGNPMDAKDDDDDIHRPVVWQAGEEVSRPPPPQTGQEDAPGGAYLYTRPLCLTTRDLMKDDDSDALFSKLSFVLMFNLALCNHLLALPQQQDATARHHETKKRRLSSAIRLYELTLELNVLEDNNDDDDDDSIGMMIAMTALWNNLAVAYQQQQQQLQAQSLPPSHPYQSIILERLVCAVMYLVDTTSLHNNEGQEDDSTFRTEAIQGFLSNIMPFLAGGSDAITAPAA